MRGHTHAFTAVVVLLVMTALIVPYAGIASGQSTDYSLMVADGTDLKRLSSDGSVTWSVTPFVSPITAMETNENGTTAVGGDSGEVALYEPDGTEAWSTSFDTHTVHGVTIYNTSYVVILTDGGRAAYHYANGTQAWQFTFTSPDGGAASDTNGNLFMSSQQEVQLIDADTGTELDGNAEPNTITHLAATPNRVHYTDRRPTYGMYTTDGTTITIEFRYLPKSDPNDIGLRNNTTHADVSYLGLDNGEIESVFPDNQTFYWNRTLGTGDIAVEYTEQDNTLWAGTETGDLYQLDSDTGSTLETYSGFTDVVAVESFEGTMTPVTETSLELDINRWMPQDSTQSYTVYLNETNTTSGYTNLTDVTADANVTIYNITNTSSFSEPIATVNNTTDTIRSYNETGKVAVNATWNGEQANATNLTVGPRNLSNIGIMPPEQWTCSFLECDSAPGGGENPHNIGSSMQWILFIVVVMSTASRMFNNPWAGLGGGMITSILLWVLGFVTLAVVLPTVFSGIFLGLLMIRSRRMSVTTSAS